MKTIGRIDKFESFVICIKQVHQIMHSDQILRLFINAFKI